MNRYYVMDDDGLVQPASLDEWARFTSALGGRRIDSTEVGDFEVSTVFLGIDHQFGDGPPLLFETMIFAKVVDSPLDQRCWRWSTRDQAVAGHARVVEALRAGRDPETEVAA